MQLKQILVAFSRTTWTSPRLIPITSNRQKISIRTRDVGRIFCIMCFLSGKLLSQALPKTVSFDLLAKIAQVERLTVRVFTERIK